jgi:hypothetical protein
MDFSFSLVFLVHGSDSSGTVAEQVVPRSLAFVNFPVVTWALSNYPERGLLVNLFKKNRIQVPLKKRTPWPQSASELHRPRDHLLLDKLMLTYADRVCRVVRAIDPYGRII